MNKKEKSSITSVSEKLKEILEILKEKRENWHGMYSFSTEEINKVYKLHQEVLEAYEEELRRSAESIKEMQKRINETEAKLIKFIQGKEGLLKSFDA